MDLRTLLGGLAGGLQGVGQGFGQVNDMRQQDVQNQLRQKQFDAGQEERKRAAVMEAWQQIEGGSQIAPEQAQSFKDIGLPVIKGADGAPMKAKSKQQELIDLQIQGHQMDLEEKTKQQGYRDFVENMDPTEFYSLPPQTREFYTQRAGMDKWDTLTPDEKIRFSERVASANASAQARIIAASQPRPQDPQVMALNRQKFEASMRATAERLARTGVGAWMTPDKLAPKVEEIYQGLIQGAGQEGMAQPPMGGPAAAPTAPRGKIVGIRQVG